MSESERAKKRHDVNAFTQQRALRGLFVTGSALLLLIFVGTMGYRWLEQMNTLDAFYMAVITISTVGFGEVQQLSPSGRLFTIILILGGGGVMAYALSSAAEFFLSGEWRMQLKRRQQQYLLEQLNHHTIVCGCGRMGSHVVSELHVEDRQFVVVEPDEEKVNTLQEQGHLALVGSGSNEYDLLAAGIDRAASLVAATGSDAENVFIALTARSLKPDLVIVARANDDGSEGKLLRAGANRVILPYRICGKRMVSLLVRPDVADFLEEVMHTNQLELLLDQVRLSPDSTLVGQTLGQASFRNQLAVTVLACRLPAENIRTSPSAETVLEANAQLIVLGTPEQLQRLHELAQDNSHPVPPSD